MSDTAQSTTGTQVSVTVKNGKKIISGPNGEQVSDNKGSSQGTAQGVQTQAKQGDNNSVNSGNTNTTTKGNTQQNVGGNAGSTSTSVTINVGSPSLSRSGAVDIANQMSAAVASLSAQNANTKDKDFSLSASFQRITKAITNVTKSIDEDHEEMEVTGNVWKDLGNVVEYYWKMLSQYSIQNTIHRIELAVLQEIQIMQLHLQMIKDNAKKVKASWDGLWGIKENLNAQALLTDPTKEDKSGATSMTKHQVEEKVTKKTPEHIPAANRS